MTLPIRNRIDAAYKAGMRIHELAALVFPTDQFPRAWRYATNGGPPAWVRVLKPALKRHGYYVAPGAETAMYDRIYRNSSHERWK